MKKYFTITIFLIVLSQISFGQNSNLESQNIVLKEALNKFPNLKIDEISNFSPNWSSQSRVDYFYKESEFFEINRDRAKEKFWEGFAISAVAGTVIGLVSANSINNYLHKVIHKTEPDGDGGAGIAGAGIGLGIGAIIGVFVGWRRSHTYKDEMEEQKALFLQD